ncbi:MAG: glutathione S-transferase family protein [Burkholderiaceae bacterium]|nr:glutathione S-transferase family protein [Burkholderiaceae bacterium]
MKFYDFTLAPNPRRVRMFMAEKGIALPETIQVNTREREQFADWFQAINARSTVPVLELDDGTRITESVSICRYFEALHPEPSLLGRDAREQALIDMWNRKVEIECFNHVGDALRNGAPMFEGRAIAGYASGMPQIQALAERGRRCFQDFLVGLDHRLATSRFIAGDEFSIADITAVVAIDTAKRVELEIPENLANARRWYDEVSARPSAQA